MVQTMRSDRGVRSRAAGRSWLPWLLWTVLAGAVPSAAAAETVPIFLTVDDADWPLAAAPAANAVLELDLAGCGGEIAFGSPAAHREVQVTAPGEATVDLPSRSRWRLKVRSDAVWGPQREITADGRPIELHVAPAIRLDAQLVFPSAETPPVRALVRYTGGPGASTGAPAESVCPVGDDGLMRCVLPAGYLTLRIDPGPPFAPLEPLFRVVSPEGTEHLGMLRVARAVSLTGCVETASGRLPAGTVVVLQPLPYWPNAISNPLSVRPLYESVRRSAAVPAGGCFEFTGLGPGWFTLHATASGYAARPYGPFHLDGERMVTPFELARLAPGYAVLPKSSAKAGGAGAADIGSRRLLLKPAADLEVEVTPPLDPEGHRWHVGFSGFQSQPEGWDLPCGEADELGRWSAVGVSPGSEMLQVGQGPGCEWGAWALRSVEPAPSMAPVVISISIPYVGVEGRLTLDGAPLAASFVFRAPENQIQVAMSSGPDGSFRATLPHDGAWVVQVAIPKTIGYRRLPVEVRRQEGAAAKAPVHLDLALAGAAPGETR